MLKKIFGLTLVSLFAVQLNAGLFSLPEARPGGLRDSLSQAGRNVTTAAGTAAQNARDAALGARVAAGALGGTGSVSESLAATRDRVGTAAAGYVEGARQSASGAIERAGTAAGNAVTNASGKVSRWLGL